MTVFLRVALVGAVAMASASGNCANLYFSPAADDNNLYWDNV